MLQRLHSGISAKEIDLLIVSTLSAETVMPSVSCRIQERIGAVRAVCFDLNAACSGFLLAYQSAEAYLESGAYKTALIIGSERLSNIIDWKDRNSCILFGDGAGAVVLTCTDKKGYRFISHSDGSMGNALMLEHHYDRNLETEQRRLSIEQSASSKVSMDGQAVFRFAVRRVPQLRVQADDAAAGKSGDKPRPAWSSRRRRSGCPDRGHGSTRPSWRPRRERCTAERRIRKQFTFRFH